MLGKRMRKTGEISQRTYLAATTVPIHQCPTVLADVDAVVQRLTEGGRRVKTQGSFVSNSSASLAKTLFVYTLSGGLVDTIHDENTILFDGGFFTGKDIFMGKRR